MSGGFAGITLTNSYNKRLQPVFISAATPTQTVLSLGYDLGLGISNNGNVLRVDNNRDTTRSVAYTYDPLNRLLTAETVSSSLWANRFEVDAWGNLNKMLAHNGKPLAQNLDQSSSVKNQIVGFCYDAAGNLLQQGTCPADLNNSTYRYDAENRLSSTAGVSYSYDGDGVRVKKTGTDAALYWASSFTSGPLAESDLAGTISKEFVHFGGDRTARRDASTGAVHYFFSDHLGSANVVTSATGTIEEESDFYPFGGERVIVNSLADQDYKFTSKERDPESGCDYFGARHYGSTIGRFMSADAPFAGQSIRDPQSWNLYSYSQNSPLNYLDPDGHSPKSALSRRAAAKIAAKLAEGRALKALRQKAVDQAWRMEREKVMRSGKGSREWTKAQKKELIDTNRVNGYDGHHINSVKGFPEQAGNPNNVEFLTRDEHFAKHGGDWHNITAGDLIYRLAGVFGQSEDDVDLFLYTYENASEDYLEMMPEASNPESVMSWVNPFNDVVDTFALLEGWAAVTKAEERHRKKLEGLKPDKKKRQD